jgi:hypothetical protein
MDANEPPSQFEKHGVVVKLRCTRRTTMIDRVLKSADVGSVNLPFPGYTGDIKINF